MKWTESQQNAIEAENSNILVSAAAGSGKTAVLVQRVINKILKEGSDTDLDELLVVTFTNAAAAEMKVRISNALNEIIRENPDNQRALKQLSLLPSAQICTIDSFCINLVRENFFRLDIEQDFRILDSTEASVIEQNVIEGLVDELYESEDSEFKSVVELLSTTKDDSGLISTVLKINNYISSQPHPLEWLKNSAEIYNPAVSIDDNPIAIEAEKLVMSALNYILEIIKYETQLLVPGDEMYDEYSKMLQGDAKTVGQTAVAKSWDELKDRLLSISFSRTPRAKKGFSSSYKDILLEKRKTYASSGSIINQSLIPLVSPSSQDIKNDNALLYPVFKALIKIVEEFDRRMLEYKREISAYTFSDIEHFAIDLLTVREDGRVVETGLASEMSRHYKEILVDEYQDVNSAQDMLFKTLSNGRNLFAVGDVKQSIYRFRLAEPSIFIKRKELSEPYNADSSSAFQKIILDRNFRSRKDICLFTNFVFSNLMRGGDGDINYTKEEYLNPRAEYPDLGYTNITYNIVEAPKGDERVEHEARQVAEFILKKIKNRETVFDKGEAREAGFGDFAVLLRSAKNSMPVFVRVFSEYGIPVFANNRSNLFDSNEVSVLLSLLQVIDNPIQDVPLLAVLTSVFYGYSANQIANARVKYNKESLYFAICNDGETFSAFLNDLEKYKKYASSMSVENLIKQILSDTSYLALISVMDNGEQRRLNVMKLADIAKRFDSGENVGLTAFMRYVDMIKESSLAVESAEASGGENAVSIMSVHKSKGLEFPIVILADSSRKYNLQDERASVIFNQEYGLGLKVNVEQGLYRYDSVQYSVMKALNLNRAMSENLRVLYVAITRAKEQFAVFASFNEAEKHISSLGKKVIGKQLSSYVVNKASCDADLLLLCALTHKDAGALREKCTNEIPVNEDFDFNLKVNFLNGFDEPEEQEARAALPDNELVQKIKNKLSFRYERAGISNFISKRKASSLDEKNRNFEYFASATPSFLSKSGLTPAERGTAMHAFMQYCDYSLAKSGLEKEIKRLASGGFLTEEQAASLSRKRLSLLFNSAFACRMFKSRKIYRELKLSAFVPLNKLENTEYDDRVLVQGVADCVFEEDDGLVLVDYKTDYVENENELLERYKNQISFYKYAVEKTLQKNVKDSYLYSFSLGRECRYKELK